MREETQLRIVKEVLETYSAKELLSKHLKRFFYRNRQLGSRDRRVIQQFVYNYFRIGNALKNKSTETKLAVANYICNYEDIPLLKSLLEKFAKSQLSSREDSMLDSKTVSQTFEEKIKTVSHLISGFRYESIFPFHNDLTERIEMEPFLQSFLNQPKLWIRIKDDFLKPVEDELSEKKILFGKINSDKSCLYLKNATSLDNLETFKNGYFEVQDRSSQETLKFIRPKANEYWWDACAGAGGKTLMMHDNEPSLNTYVTDVRESVLENLKDRFKKAKIKGYRAERIDVANLPDNFILPLSKPQDGIVADVPCSGSGTWARTPEWLQMFDRSSIGEFESLQRSIVANLVRYLPEGKPLIYITCSVFKQENEGNVDYFTKNLPLVLESSGYIHGYMHGADTLFAARLNRRL